MKRLSRGIAKSPNPKPVTPWVKPAARNMIKRKKYTVMKFGLQFNGKVCSYIDDILKRSKQEFA
jgi:hypothetical protein